VFIVLIVILLIIHYNCTYLIYLGWLDSIGSRIVCELDHKKPILYVMPVENVLGKLPVVTVGDSGTIPHRLLNHFSGAPGDRRPGSGDGCRMWLSTRGHWDDPVTCNEAGLAVRASVVQHVKNVPCDHAKAPCFRHIPPMDLRQF
jgi:hypothetical protein